MSTFYTSLVRLDASPLQLPPLGRSGVQGQDYTLGLCFYSDSGSAKEPNIRDGIIPLLSLVDLRQCNYSMENPTLLTTITFSSISLYSDVVLS